MKEVGAKKRGTGGFLGEAMEAEGHWGSGGPWGHRAGLTL